jgi:hypothetical protein
VHKVARVYKFQLQVLLEANFANVHHSLGFCLRAPTQQQLPQSESMSSSKRATMSAISPLDNEGILLDIINILGPGHHLFISAVSKAWRESYKSVATVQIATPSYRHCGSVVQHTITSETTLCSAVFASAALLRLVRHCGFAFDYGRLEYIAGRVADMPTLQAAHELGLALSDEVLKGAAEAASVPKLQWLHTKRSCPLPADICEYAALSGSVNLLRWLKDHGGVLTARACKSAAAGAHVPLLQYLRSVGCEWDETTCSAAAEHGHLSTLQWLRQQGCAWDSERITGDAALSGNHAMLLYLRQQGCVYDEGTMANAAVGGHLHLCQFLAANGCPWGNLTAQCAAFGGHFSTLRWLHENGSPWDARVCRAAADFGTLQMLQYLKQQGCAFDAMTMMSASYEGHTDICQYLRSEQCPWDTDACMAAAAAGHADTLRWLHEQGCPWDVHAVRVAAAGGGHLTLLEFMQQIEPAASAVQLTELLQRTGRRCQFAKAAGCRTYDHLAVLKWLRQQGAEWPAALRYRGTAWGALCCSGLEMRAAQHLLLPVLLLQLLTD